VEKVSSAASAAAVDSGSIELLTAISLAVGAGCRTAWRPCMATMQEPLAGLLKHDESALWHG